MGVRIFVLKILTVQEKYFVLLSLSLNRIFFVLSGLQDYLATLGDLFRSQNKDKNKYIAYALYYFLFQS